MRRLAIAVVLALSASPVVAQTLAQADANLAPGGIVDGSRATIDAAEGTSPDGRPAPGGRQGEGKQSATDGSKMIKQGDSGTQPAAKAGTSNKP